MRRHEITDKEWHAIKDLLPNKVGDPWRTAEDNRLFINAVLWIARTSARWRDLPERFGEWNSVFQRVQSLVQGRSMGPYPRCLERSRPRAFDARLNDHPCALAYRRSNQKKGTGDRAVDSAPSFIWRSRRKAARSN